MRTQTIRYCVSESRRSIEGAGYADHARFIFHTGYTAYLFGRHEGKTLVVEFLTTGFLLRVRRLQTI